MGSYPCRSWQTLLSGWFSEKGVGEEEGPSSLFRRRYMLDHAIYEGKGEGGVRAKGIKEEDDVL